MLHRFLLLTSAFSLGACAYIVDKSIQDITVRTPGARGAVCHVYVEGLRYDVHPPNTISVSKNGEDMLVDCLAPGNRRKEVVIKPQISEMFYANVSNAFIGAPWDALSGAMYEYPFVIEVSFVNTPVRDEEPPAQNALDIKQPEEYRMEQFGSSTPLLNEDFTRDTGHVMQRRQKNTNYSRGFSDDTISSPPAGSYQSKGDLQPVAPSPSIDINPASSSTSGPVPLYPGE